MNDIFELMHYSLIIVGRQKQIDLHFEPNPVFSDYESGKYFIPNLALEENNWNSQNMFPYQSGMIKEMITEFHLENHCGKSRVLIIIRVNESNSAHMDSRVENSLLAEFHLLGFAPLIIEAEQLLDFRLNQNSLWSNGLHG